MKNQSVIAKNHTKQEIRVIASEQGERSNPNLCHTEGEARSISNITKQERYFANAQYDKNIDCHADFDKSARNDRMSPSLAEGARGWVNSHKSPELAQKLAPKLAIVVPCYNEEAVIAHTYNALCKKLDSLITQNLIAKDSFLCFVDDGSKDKTCEILLSLKSVNAHCHIERSEVSQNQNRYISFSAKPQYDKEVDCREFGTFCHSEGAKATEESQKLNRDISPTAQYDKNMDCHADFDKSVRNDKYSPSLAKNTPPQPLPQGEGLIFDSPSLEELPRSISPSLAEGDKGGGYQYTINSSTAQFANADSTLPLTPSAREGEMERGNSSREGEQEKRNSAMEGEQEGKTHTGKGQESSDFTRELEQKANPLSLRASKASVAIQNNSTTKYMDCHEFANADSRNDEAITEPHNEKTIRNNNKHKILKLSRNYGHQNALLAGLEYVKDKCDCVASIDGDLQQDINAIDEMLFKFKGGAEIVYGVRKARDNDTAFKKYTALIFYKFMHIMGVKILYNHADYRLLSARACEALLEFREVNLFLRGIVPLVGYKSAVVHYDRAARFAGESKYPLTKMLGFALNGITSFSIVPLRMMSVVGVVLCVLSVIYGGYAIFVKLFTDSTLEGWTSIILILLFFGGMQFLGFGIMGEYIGKIYAEVKHRPRYFVDEVL